MSLIFLPAILGPKMAAPILWAPGIFAFFLQENLGGFGVLGGGWGSADFIRTMPNGGLHCG